MNIEHGAYIHRNISIDDESGIGINAYINAEVNIGKYVMMGPECMLIANSHYFDSVKRKYIGFRPSEPIIIEDDVWIGARVVILGGVTIGKGSTIGAGAVVSRSIPPYSVAVGVPARVVKQLV